MEVLENKIMTVAILYICTGKYNQFFKGFYESCEKYFLKGIASVEYFVFTDDMSLSSATNVHLIKRKCQGFPLDSLFRFDMFLQIEAELRKFDYIYFFNANAELQRPIGTEILPDESGLAMGIWPGKRERQHPMFFPYERNKKSKAYVAPHGKNYVYFMGGLNGGTAKAYLQMIQTLSMNIRDDYNRGIIAMVHDESHINAYLRTHACKKLGREFCLPEEFVKVGEQPKNIFRDKVKIDPYFNKGRDHSLKGKLKKGCKILWRAIQWYI